MVTTATPAPEVPSPAPVSSVGRIFGALFSPKPTFASIALRPTWLFPVLLGCVLFISVVAVFTQKGGWSPFFEKQNASNSRIEQLPQDQRDKILNSQLKYAPTFGYVEGVVLPFVIALVVALVLWGTFMLMGTTRTTFKTSLAIVAYASMPWVIHGLLSVLILFLKDVSTVDIQNIVASNPGALMPDDASKWLTALLSSIDIFAIWNMILLAIGFSATNPKKLKFGSAFVTVLVIWIFYTAAKVGLIAAFS
jgi:hypothetical protein